MHPNNNLIRNIISFSCSYLFLFLQNISCQEVTDSRPVLNAIRIDTPIELTGTLDNSAWDLAQQIELKYETDPGDNLQASQRTIIYVLYDDEKIYFGFKCFDSNPEQIRANVSERDKMFNDDFVRVKLDLYGDYQRTYILAVNPYGIKGDLMNEDTNFDMLWEATAAKSGDGWTAEMSIPFSSLNFPQNQEQEWILSVERSLPRGNTRIFSWTKWDRDIPNQMQQAGLLLGIRNISTGGLIEILPYIMGQKGGHITDQANPNSGIAYSPPVGRVGGSIAYSPRSNLKLEAVINPDFSQIESDATQISVNTPFAINYPEKRPFFLSGKEVFSSMYYSSRTINDPLFAIKASGKTKALSYLYQSAYDRNTILIIPGEEQSNTIPTSLGSFSNVGRVTYDFGNESRVGGAVLVKNMKEAHNYVFEFDARYKFWQNWYLITYLYLTNTKELNDTVLFNSTRKLGNTGYTAGFNGEEFWGDRFMVSIQKKTKNYSMSVVYAQKSPSAQMFTAYFPSISKRQVMMNHDYIFYPDDSFIDKGTIGVNSVIEFNYDGIKKYLQISPVVSLTMKGQTNLSVSYNLINEEKYFGKDFKKINNANINIDTKPLKELSISMNLQVGNFIYYSSNPTLGNGHNLTSSIQTKPTPKLDISLSYSRAKLSSNDTGQLFYDGNIFRAIVIYNFSSKIFIRSILQYDSFANAIQFYPLFSYRLNAFTTFYAGATSNYLDYGEGFGIKNTDQQYFVKIQYLFGN